MTYETYKILHLTGIVWLFASLGAQALHGLGGGTRESHPARGLIMGSHGVALLLTFVAGFGLHAKAQIQGYPGWFWGKLLVWLALGALIAVPVRKPALAKPAFLALPFLGGLAAWLAIGKPF
jgi:hypothetical protein